MRHGRFLIDNLETAVSFEDVKRLLLGGGKN